METVKQMIEDVKKNRDKAVSKVSHTGE